MYLKDKSDIVKFFEEGCKKKNKLKIGVEHEKFVFNNKSKSRINFQTVLKIFHYLRKYNWRPIKEGKNIISLSKENKTITLEPGNQIELSGAKLNNLHLSCNESYKFLKELKLACESLNLNMMSVSFDPISNLKKVPKNPKLRYKIMTKEMPKNGKLSLEMMHQTTGTQINLDYTSEKDFIKKFKLASNLVPLSIAIFANSPFKENKLNKYLSYRSKVWQNTSRGGLPKSYLEGMNFEKYADYIMNYPLLFFKKKNNYLFSKNKTFKDFIENKIRELDFKGPTKKDLEIHLSTVFTEIRLKKYIEIRSLDTCEWSCHCAGPAFFLGILYQNLYAALDIIKNWKAEEVLNAYKEAPKKGLQTLLHNKSLLFWGKIFLKLSEEGLRKRSIKNKNGKDESVFLDSIKSILSNNKTKAELSIEKFKINKSFNFLYEKN
jgi:glutamate--cysteine ligase